MATLSKPQTNHVQTPLLRRLLATETTRQNAHDSVDEVAEALSLLLNTRRGSVAACPEYGLPDFNEFTHMPSQLLKTLERILVQAIATYEPRLREVKVMGTMDEDQPDRMCFHINGLMRLGQEQLRVHYRSVLTPEGRVWVKP